ncbi:(2Fe-2S)-binding protein [Azospirillum sp. SYSU D00513]|uniref:(2Fe-2S)-binding protein n=1 Tax=Azospirillum sp. SYSU D00513 TaxID=2812561 RepID=UPI001A95BBA8|nr:(2Fe-2S)-binding protein [Azospirillum sp. SYSU D00513]
MMTLTVNGVEHRFDGDPEMPLLWYLRDELGLTGTKFGCGVAQCGACTIHVDGQAAFSCVTPIGTVEGTKITTIEGLSSDGNHPVQTAWRELNVSQCGYCQAGQIMQASALLAATPNPSDEDIDGTMSANLCRCGTYTRIRTAIKQAAQGQSAERRTE